ncbi:GPI transamidase component [Phytophthora megakarya]|uniref:GPI transamidase component n=1 Tax=Phytophthora megakarya TaxID=4795 RepID=A0A225V9S3_9STRA|nr:GPI transamidase component [Phytophthora megakarya]
MLLVLCLLLLLHGAFAAFTEQLTLRPLPVINQILGHFAFSVDETSSLDGASLFPILEKHDAESLHLTFSVGRYAGWRYRSAQSFNSSNAPFGGIFSASLNQMDETVVTGLMAGSTPQELGAFPRTKANPALVFLHGSLAREELCIENLTPWLKMLPCRAISGLGALIDPINAVSSNVVTTDHRKQPVSLSSPWFEDWKLAAEEAASRSNYRAQQDVYHDVIPWYLRMYFHTFRATASGSEQKAQELIEAFDFVPAELRGRPNKLRLKAYLPANTTLVFSLQMEKAFLHLSEHPPDANRGFDIASGIATFDVVHEGAICGKEVGAQFTTTLFTEPLLVPLPTPDFSMPYNGITMTSTVVAFSVGTMLNALTKGSSPEANDDK